MNLRRTLDTEPADPDNAGGVGAASAQRAEGWRAWSGLTGSRRGSGSSPARDSPLRGLADAAEGRTSSLDELFDE